MRLRRVTNDDLADLVTLDRTCFAGCIAYTKGQFRSFLSLKNNIGYLIEKEERVIAFILTTWSRDAAEIITVDVDPAYRRKRLGTKMLHRIERELKSRGILTECLHVSVGNIPAVEFYQNEGFEVLDRIKDYYRDEGDALFMVKPLV